MSDVFIRDGKKSTACSSHQKAVRRVIRRLEETRS